MATFVEMTTSEGVIHVNLDNVKWMKAVMDGQFAGSVSVYFNDGSAITVAGDPSVIINRAGRQK